MMGERIDIPACLHFKEGAIHSIYISEKLKSEMCNLLEVKNPKALSFRIITLIKKKVINVEISEEGYFLLSYNENLFGGKVIENTSRIYGVSLTKISSGYV